jgi:phosphoglycerol geranylgeranyltransferase
MRNNSAMAANSHNPKSGDKSVHPLNQWTFQIEQGQKQLSVLVDPDKCTPEMIPKLLDHLPGETTHILVGGSTVAPGVTHELVQVIKKQSPLPLWIFPGDAEQISPQADALLFLSLVSGDNPEYLIGQQARAAAILRTMELPTIATAYMLIDGGVDSAVARVTATQPLGLEDTERIINRALAAYHMGAKAIYLEAGSGAHNPVPTEIIRRVKTATALPLIVGGGLRQPEQIQNAWGAGADMVVVGTAIEEILSLTH